jgi:hypothetical protein
MNCLLENWEDGSSHDVRRRLRMGGVAGRLCAHLRPIKKKEANLFG